MAGRKSSWHYLALISEIGLVMVSAIILTALLGSWLDGRLGTSPWLLLLGIVLGVVSGGLGVYRTIAAMEAKGDDD